MDQINLEFMQGWPEGWQKQVKEYLAGKRKDFAARPKLVGTGFQKAVWRAIAKIPYGDTRTYAELARDIGKPKAVRAVGTACGKNQFPIIIPCHRVVGSHGLGGYAFGLEMKKQLLAIEQRYK